MRILLTHHAPLSESPTGRLVRRWSESLLAAGDEVRVLVVDQQAGTSGNPPVTHVVCGAADSPSASFLPPRFRDEEAAPGCPGFSELTDDQLAHYRDCLRLRLDEQMLDFDPHVVHVQHIWVMGQLALESGVPYVVSAWNAEQEEFQYDPRYHQLAQQTAENASRILVADAATRLRVQRTFDTTPERMLVMPEQWLLDAMQASEQGEQPNQETLLSVGQQLHALYEAVHTERFG